MGKEGGHQSHSTFSIWEDISTTLKEKIKPIPSKLLFKRRINIKICNTLSCSLLLDL